MYLRKLEVSGFKSFASRSVLDFEKDARVAAIVGPNGSGKSNIADAIRWVLGETSYKTVRAKKSEDVIFSGSNGKSRASFAKVSMLLDNADGKAPIDFTEVEIARSVFRDGTSEYLINGKKSRLLDVAELLAKSGFGQSTYSVIGQGMVDSMLFYGPAERKVLFDEAAGVRGYEIKREQTMRKLEDTNGNIIRAKDILAELNPRLNTLKRHAEKAKEKDNIKGELLENQKVYFSSLWDRLSVVEKEKRTDLEKIIAEETKLQSEIADLNQKFNDIISQEKSKGGETEGLQQKIDELEDQKDQVRQTIFTLRAKMEIKGSALTKKEIEAKIKEHQKALEALDLESKKKSKEELVAKIEGENNKGFGVKIEELEKEKDVVREEIFKLRAKLEREGGVLSAKEIAERIATAQGEIENLNERGLRSEEQDLKSKAKLLGEDLAIAEKTISAKRNKLAELTEKLANIDFGSVGEKVSVILYNQNDFLLKVEAAKDMNAVAEAINTGKKVQEQLKELRKEVGAAKEGKITGMAEMQEELEKLLDRKESLAKEISEVNSKVWKIDFEIKRMGDKRFALEKELGELNDLRPADDTEKKQIEKEIKNNQEKIQTVEEKIAALRTEKESINGLKSELLRVEFELRGAEQEGERLEAEIKRLTDLKPAEAGEKQKIEAEIETHQAEIAKMVTQIVQVREEMQKESNDFEGRSKNLAEIKDALYSKQHLLGEFTAEVTKLKVELAKTETKKQDIREEIHRELGTEAVLADAKVVPELNEEAARAEIEKLKGKLYSIGEIDPEVETEYKEVSARVEFLNVQVGDLEKAKTDLEKLVSELDGRIKKQFEASFEAIASKFSHFFDLLFDGGTAKLELVKSKNEPDPNEASPGKEESEQFGIEITAIPPGKRVQALSALSGGERTLTSLALLFAILSVNPAPFCVLDEVDAALDETNTKKFLKIVHELSNHTQFIFISHNRETMKEASIIYGITMDDTHASKILSIKLGAAMEVADKKASKV